MDIQSTLTQAIEVIVMSFVALMIFDFIDGLYVVPLPSIAIAQFNSGSESAITATQFEPLSNTEQVKVEPQQIPLVRSQFEEISDQAPSSQDDCIGGGSSPDLCRIPYTLHPLHPTPYTLLPDPWTLELEPHNSSAESQPVVLPFPSLRLLPPAIGVQPKSKAKTANKSTPLKGKTTKTSKTTAKATSTKAPRKPARPRSSEA